MLLTMAAVAAHKNISPDGIGVRIDCRTRKRRPASAVFEVQVELSPGLTRREIAILYNSARSCDVSNMLTGDIDFTYILAPFDSA